MTGTRDRQAQRMTIVAAIMFAAGLALLDDALHPAVATIVFASAGAWLIGSAAVKTRPYARWRERIVRAHLDNADHDDYVTGWRIWWIADEPPKPARLQSLRGHLWENGEPMQGQPTILLPKGVHAFKTRDAAEAYGGRLTGIAEPMAIGKVSLWGEVVEFQEGWRGEYGYPLEIWVDNTELAQGLRRTYGCIVHDASETARAQA